jgi:hypothetical protein
MMRLYLETFSGDKDLPSALCALQSILRWLVDGFEQFQEMILVHAKNYAFTETRSKSVQVSYLHAYTFIYTLKSNNGNRLRRKCRYVGKIEQKTFYGEEKK